MFGAVLTLIGDLLIGAGEFPEGADMISGYFAVALAVPAWRPAAGGLIGFLGICLEFCALMTICPLIRKNIPACGRFYQLAMYVYLAVGGGAVEDLILGVVVPIVDYRVMLHLNPSIV